MVHQLCRHCLSAAVEIESVIFTIIVSHYVINAFEYSYLL